MRYHRDRIVVEVGQLDEHVDAARAVLGAAGVHAVGLGALDEHNELVDGLVVELRGI